MPKSARHILVTSVFCGAMTLSLGAFAKQDNKHYGAWNNPNQTPALIANSDSVKKLIVDLKALVQKAEQDRAANPRFLQDLKNLAARYENPWNISVLSDDFRDGDYDRDPRWSVTSGEYWVEQGYGLRNKITTVSTNNTGQTESKKLSREQLAFSILGAVLNRNKGATTQAPPPQAVSKPASIMTRLQIPNQFLATLQLSSWKAQGRFEIGMLQGTGGLGYRISYTPGINGGQSQLELLKISMRGQSVIEGVKIPPLEDKRVHKVAWTRSNGGRINVQIDGKVMINTQDQSFKDAFSSLQMTSDGADVIVRSVSVMGAR